MNSREGLIIEYKQKLAYLYNLKGQVSVTEFELRELERKLCDGNMPMPCRDYY